MRLVRVVVMALVSLTLLAVVGLATAFFVVWAPTNTVDAVDFRQPLAIPPLAESRVDPDGTRVFQLNAQAGTTELLPGKPTETWGFNGSYLGPTLRAERGEKVRVEVHNDLDETTSVHWHGMHLQPPPTEAPTSRLLLEIRGRRPGASINRPRRCGTTPTLTARPRTMSTADWPACSFSTTPPAIPPTACLPSTAWMTSP